MILIIFLLNSKGNITMPIEKYICVGKELASESPLLVPVQYYERFIDTIPWMLMDTFRFSEPLLNNSSFALTNSNWCITYSIAPETLSALANLAVSYAPRRFRDALIAAFHRLGGLSDFYAQLILNTPLKCVDEVIFQISHIGAEILSYLGFDPELLIINAELLYEIDDSLPYVDIVDHSLPDGDYYSTVRYRILENGDSIWIELPWEVYYNYIVHPIITDEFPDMGPYVYNKFWREYLFYAADSGYPKLSREIRRTKILWNGQRMVLPGGRPFTPEDCALDVIANWVTYTVPQSAQGNRPIQPNIIAHEHNGNCGELQDLLTAAARACLVLCVATNDPCEDHAWSEFYEQGFYPYQVDLGFNPTHIADTNIAYDEQHGGSKRVSGIFNWRGDGYWWAVTGRYSNFCSLYVYVYDLMGRPVDGASVTIASEGYYGGMYTSTRAYSDPNGECRFELGDLRNFYARIWTPIDSYPSGSGTVIQIIENSQSGAKYYKSFYLSNYLPALRFSDTTNVDSLYLWKIEAILEPLSGQSYGRCGTRYGPGDSIILYRSFFEQYPKGNIDLFFVDGANLLKYLAGEQFKAFNYVAAVCDTSNFIAQDFNTFHLLVSNEDVLYYTPFCDLKINLYKNPLVGTEEKDQDKLISQSLETIFKSRITFNLNEPLRIRIYEVSGRLIYDSVIKVDKLAKRLSSGVYFVNLSSEKKNKISKIVVVK